ncbi:MAG: aminotransferase class III-fold pyridoxal phosphate-dependent enzyme, partial [Dehalococcoidia bacterium]|nr:aminotransferase class III-fold pyridoxal phosphate-dependent enzyme [Dehalococcoidia bacterium]
DNRTFFHGHTYTGNPVACAAVLASLDIFTRDRTIEKLQGKIAQLEKGLQRFRELPSVGDIRQRGLMAGIELVSDKANKTPYPPEMRMGARVARESRPRGAILRPLGDVVVLMPPLSIKKAELARLLDITYDSIAAATAHQV